MNRLIAKVYATSIGAKQDAAGNWVPDVQRKLIDIIPELIAEIQRLERRRKCPACGGCGYVEELPVSETGEHP